jgi:hypothetical protein
MSHLAKALALSVVLSCSGSKPAEPPAAVPGAELAAAEPAPDAGALAPSSVPAADPSAPAAVSQSVTQTLFVAEAHAACQGEVAQQCLRVRESESEPYRNLYSSIAGFSYEPAYVYELRVEATTIPNPPADGSAVRYRLIEVVAKRKAAAGKSP